MNILVIPTSYPSFYAPTRNLFIREQVEALTNLGNCVTVLHVIKEPTVSLFKKINYSVKRI